MVVPIARFRGAVGCYLMSGGFGYFPVLAPGVFEAAALRVAAGLGSPVLMHPIKGEI